MRSLLILLITAALFSCKKESSQTAEGTQSEAYYEAYIRKNLTALPEVPPNLLAATNPGFATFKEAYDYFRSAKIVGMSGTKYIKIDLTKTGASIGSPTARTLSSESVWYQSTGIYTGALIGNSAWPFYVYISVNVVPLVYYNYRVDLNNVKEYYELTTHDMNFSGHAYTLSGPGAITPSGSGNVQPTFIQQLIQHEVTIQGTAWSKTIDYWLSTDITAELPTWDNPPAGIQLNYQATGSYL